MKIAMNEHSVITIIIRWNNPPTTKKRFLSHETKCSDDLTNLSAPIRGPGIPGIP